MKDRILIINFGSQFTQLIARQVRQQGVYCEIQGSEKASVDFIKKFQCQGIILSGGPDSVLESGFPRLEEEVWELGLPILGICYGQQLMCIQLNGIVATCDHSKEFGKADLEILEDCKLFEGLWKTGQIVQVCMSHGDYIKSIPKGFRKVAQTIGASYAVIVNDQRQFYGLQFHPEVLHTPDGSQLIDNFLKKVCGCQGEWSMISYKDQSIEDLKNQIGNKRVICALSGGVDSTVTAVLLHRAIGDNLTCIFVDHGLLLKNEKVKIEQLMEKLDKIPLIIVDASERFLTQLKDISDPEQKRKIIGRLFIEVFEEEAKKLGGADFLAQGTLNSDIIESKNVSSKKTITIKSHHNVGGLPNNISFPLIEPLKTLFKDEVRLLGKELGIPMSILNRHPFPGPGLAIRILGCVDHEKCEILRQVDAIYLEEIEKSGLYNEIWQAFAILLPIRTVGVMGDNRTYDYTCVLRAVNSIDSMTAEVYPFQYKFLSYVSTRIVNEVRGVNRVTYDYTSKPPGTIEWE